MIEILPILTKEQIQKDEKDKDIYDSPTFSELSDTQLKNENFNYYISKRFITIIFLVNKSPPI